MKISFVISEYFQGNRIFDESNSIVNRDDCQRQYIELRKKLLRMGVELDTNDITLVEDADLVFFINVPDKEDAYFQKALSMGKPCYVLINELDLIHKGNKSIEMHQHFSKIFTYQHDLIDNKKYFKANYSFDFAKKWEQVSVKPFVKKKLATLIAGNKKLDDPLELYSERVKTIRWFERNHPDKFDLYGTGWNNYERFIQSFFSRKFSSYRGKIIAKNETLSSYKFNICYENAQDVPGWITEKIFDSFFAGCIPVYWGWEGVELFIDKGCFISRTDFKNHKELYLFLSSISEAEYGTYLDKISSFLLKAKNDTRFEFGIPYYVKTISDQILKDFK